MTAGPLHLISHSVCLCVKVLALELTKQFILVGTGSFTNYFLIEQDKSSNELFFLPVFKNPALGESVEFPEGYLCSFKTKTCHFVSVRSISWLLYINFMYFSVCPYFAFSFLYFSFPLYVQMNKISIPLFLETLRSLSEKEFCLLPITPAELASSFWVSTWLILITLFELKLMKFSRV